MTSLLRLARKSLLLWFGAAFLADGLVSLSMGVVRSDGTGTALATLLVGGVFALIGAFFFFTNAHRLGRQWSILKTGDIGQGTVLAIVPTSTTISRVRQ